MKTGCVKKRIVRRSASIKAATNPFDALVPKAGTALAGRTLRGGLIFAGVDGAPEDQGDPQRSKWRRASAPPMRFNPDTVLRGGYGTFYAPWQYNATNHGQIGFARITALIQSSAESDVPITTLDNPFPGGLQQPIGSSLGLLTGVGGDINYIDQDKGAPIVHQYSFDLQRELAGDMARHDRLHGGDRPRSRVRRHQQRGPQYQPDRSRSGAADVPSRGRGMERGGAASVCAQSLLRHCASRRTRHQRDGPARAAPAAIPSVRRCQRLRADRGRQATVPRRHGGSRQAR